MDDVTLLEFTFILICKLTPIVLFAFILVGIFEAIDKHNEKKRKEAQKKRAASLLRKKEEEAARAKMIEMLKSL